MAAAPFLPDRSPRTTRRPQDFVSASAAGQSGFQARPLRRIGRIRLPPCRLEVNSAARISPVALSSARCTFRHSRLRVAPCLRASHSPSPRKRMPVLSAARQGIAPQCPRGDQQLQRRPGAPMRDLHRDPGLTPAQRRMVGHGPVEPGHLDQARHQADGPAERQVERDLQRETGPDRIRRGQDPPGARHAGALGHRVEGALLRQVRPVLGSWSILFQTS